MLPDLNENDRSTQHTNVGNKVYVSLFIGTQFGIKHTFLRSVLTSYPAMHAVPLVGEMSPVRILNVVVLPAPVDVQVQVMNTQNAKALYILYNVDLDQSDFFTC